MKTLRIDNDVHQAAEQILARMPQCSRPSKQVFINQVLREALGVRSAQDRPRRRRAS